ncbi:MAG: glycosyltransferase family 39 protein [Planctomycetota bacterium]|nr:glycosyltransferase family 39 protein [Planctomycetota bacterium]
MNEPQKQSQPLSRAAETGIVAAMLIISAVLGISSMMLDGPTFDEPVYLMAGYQYLKSGNFGFNPEHPPLWKELAAIPIILSGVKGERFNPWAPANPIDMPTAFFRSRLVLFLLFPVTGLILFLWARECWGIYGGMMSLFFYSFSPNLLAFARLVTPDFPVAAFSFIATWAFWKFCQKLTPWSFAAAAITFGLAMSSRFTALLLVPSFGFILLLSARAGNDCPLWRKYSFKKHWWLVAAIPMALACTGMVVVAVCYGISGVPIYFRGLAKFFSHATDSGHSAFLLGQYSNNGWWYYFFVVLLLKTPVTALVASAIAAANAVRNKQHQNTNLFLFVPAIVLLAAASVNKVNLGIRLILPLFPLAFVSIGQLALMPALKKRAIQLCFGLGLIWYASSAARIHPHYISYFNELVGPENGYNYLSDSNTDWGQDLPRLALFLKEQGVSGILLAYYGLDSLQYYGVQAQYLPIGDRHQDDNLNERSNGYICNESPRLLAISVTLLKGVTLKDHDTYKWLEEMKLVRRIGYSILVFDITGNEKASEELAKIQGKFQQSR